MAVLVAVVGTTTHRGLTELSAFRHAWWVTAVIAFAGIGPAIALLRRRAPGRPVV